MRVGYLSAKNYHSRKTFSGIVHAMRQSLGERPEVEVVDLGPPPPPKGLARFTAKLGGGHQPFDLSTTSGRTRYADHVRERLDEEPADVLFAPVASVALSSVRIDLPVVYASDATFKLLATHYDLGLSHTQQRFRQGCEQAAIHRATRLIYSSSWAADSAIQDYGVDPERVEVIPFGAYIEEVPPPRGPRAARRAQPRGRPPAVRGQGLQAQGRRAGGQGRRAAPRARRAGRADPAGVRAAAAAARRDRDRVPRQG